MARELPALPIKGVPVKSYTDIRRLLENKDVDVISTATPNFWHSLIVVWACQAGKDVYVEKPVSHNVWEGRQAVEAGLIPKTFPHNASRASHADGSIVGLLDRGAETGICFQHIHQFELHLQPIQAFGSRQAYDPVE
jgi:hypothetical protein